MSWAGRAMDYVDERIGFRDLLHKNFTEYLLPRNVNIWYTLGAVLLTLFALQFVTGIFLLIYYVPRTDAAFQSVQKIMNEIPFGWFVRYVHAVGANITILALLLHMLSTLFMSAYKRPREFTWVFGFILFTISLGMCLTGYLLPWSQLSYWATTVATDTVRAFPGVGEPILYLLRGGAEVGQYTLNRFFALHVMGLPFLLGLLVLGHLFLVRRIGVSPPPFGSDFRPREPSREFHHETYPQGIPFFPNYVSKDLAMILLFLTLTMAVVFFAPWLFLPVEAFEPADPFSTPENIKPEWYFLAAYQTLRLMPSELSGILVQALAGGFLFLLPFIDRGVERRPRKRPLFTFLFVAGVLSFIAMTIWGAFS